MCRNLIKSGWTLTDVEEAEFDTLMAVMGTKKQEKQQPKIDIMDYMKQEKGLV